MFFFDWFRKKKKANTIVEDTVSQHIENKEVIFPKAEEIISFEPVIGSESEYNPLDVISVFQYVLKKYGSSVCSNPAKLRTIMADLGPNMAKESKILIALSNKNDLNSLVESSDMNDFDTEILFKKMLDYLIKEEFIDPKIAYSFLNKLL